MNQETLFDTPARARHRARRTTAARLDWPCPSSDGTIEPGPACSVCGSLEHWQDGLGRRRCGVCEADALARARRLAETAARLRIIPAFGVSRVA